MITRENEDKNPETRTIIAVDGEGWNIPLTAGKTSANPAVAVKDWHSYVMLAGADDHGFARSAVHDGTRRETTSVPMLNADGELTLDPVARNYGLPTPVCLDFLLGLPHDALITSFAFSYDVTKIMADLPLTNLIELSRESRMPVSEYARRVTEASEAFGIPIERAATLKMTMTSKLVDLATTIYDNQYWINYIPRKVLEIIDLRAGKELIQDTRDGRKMGKPERKWIRRIKVWDGFGFFQKSFVAALRDYRCGQCPSCRKAREHCGAKCGQCARENYCQTAPWTPDDIARIESMKERRGAFRPEDQAEVLAYCYSECRYLSFLMRDLLTGIYRFNPVMWRNMNRFDGSGAVASAYLKTYEVRDHLPGRVPGTLENHRTNGGHYCDKCASGASELSHCAWCGRDYPDAAALSAHLDGCMPSAIEPAAYAGLPEPVALGAYTGGRFEVPEIGYVGELHGYDINSAYPHITRDLPCLAHGAFRRVREYVPGAIGVYLAGSRTTGKFAPFAFRTKEKTPDGLAQTAIYYAHGGKRWVWQDELAIARKHFGADAIPVYDGYVWEPSCADNDCDGKPFANIPELYELRKEYVAQGNGIEKVIKLILNSLYGKTAQSVGWSERNGMPQPPASQCFIWAGLITSGCRAMILDGIMQPDADVVSIATDGILSRTRIAALDANAPREKILGKWDYGAVTDGYLFQSGVYTYLKPDPEGKEQTRDGRPGKRVYKTRGFSAKEISASELIRAWESGERTVHADPSHSRYKPMRAGVLLIDALEYIGQWVPSVHDVSFTHNRRMPVLEYDQYGDIVPGLERYSEPCVISCRECGECRAGYPHMCVNPPESAPYDPKQSWDDVLDAQPGSGDADYLEDTGRTYIRE
jgi:hypothetical protein